MTDEQVPRPPGRPRRELDATEFEKLCSMHCTQEEIAFFFGCSPDTVLRWCRDTYGCGFSEAHKWYSANGKIALRRQLMQQAMKGNTGALIFALKHYCGLNDIVTLKPQFGGHFQVEGQTRVIDDLSDVYATIEECKLALPAG